MSNPISPRFVSFLLDLLEYNPKRRLTAQDALEHAWLSESRMSNADLATACMSALPRRMDPATAYANDARLLMAVRRGVEEEVMRQLDAFKMAYAAIGWPTDEPAMIKSTRAEIYYQRFTSAMSHCIDTYNEYMIDSYAAMLKERATESKKRPRD